MALKPPDPVYTIRNEENEPVYSLAFSFLPDGLECLLAGSKNGFVYAYNLQTNRLQQKFKVGESPIIHLVHTDNKLITQERGGKYKVFDLTSKGYEETSVIETDYSGFCRFEVDTELEKIYVSDSSKITIYTFRGEMCGLLKYVTSDTIGEPMCMKFIELPTDTDKKSYLLAGYDAGWVLLWDLSSNKCVGNLKTKECPMSIDYHQGQQRGIIGNVSNIIQIFSIEKSLSLDYKSDIQIINHGINKVKTRADGKVFVTGGWDSYIRIFSGKTLRPLAVLTVHRQAIQDVIYSKRKISLWNTYIMAAGGLDGAITLWDLYNTKSK